MIRLVRSFAALTVVACVSSEPGTDSISHSESSRDSAGVTIMDNGPVNTAPVPQWAAGHRELEIGSDDSTLDQFASVTAVVAQDDGGLVVADEIGGFIRWYDSTGAPIARLARRGSGPGEFRSVSRLYAALGDTVALWDATLRRMTRFAPNGQFVDAREIPLTDLVSLALLPFHLSAVLPQANRTFLLILGSEPAKLLADKAGYGNGGGSKGSEPEGRQRQRAIVLHASPDGSAVDTVANVQDREYEAIIWPDAGPVRLEPYLARRPLVALNRNGSRCVGDQSATEVTCFRADDRARLSIRWSADDVPIDRAHAARWRDSVSRVFAQKLPRAKVARLVDAMVRPSAGPPYLALLLDTSDRLWVQQHARTGERSLSRFLVFEPGGRLLARADLPIDRLLVASESRAIGVAVNEDGVESVLVLSIARQ